MRVAILYPNRTYRIVEECIHPQRYLDGPVVYLPSVIPTWEGAPCCAFIEWDGAQKKLDLNAWVDVLVAFGFPCTIPVHGPVVLHGRVIPTGHSLSLPLHYIEELAIYGTKLL